jgi:SAM-dependent methyltransferase
MGDLALPFNSPFGRNAGQLSEQELVVNARELIAAMCEATERVDLGGTDLLDVGCGVRFTQAILANDLPVGSYTGVDVFGRLVEFLNQTVTDARFTYHHHDVLNALYNPEASETLATSPLPCPDASYDLICGFSLFTHLAPADFRLMLERTRVLARPGAWLYFTAFVDEVTASGEGFVDRYFSAMGLGAEDQLPEAERPRYREGNPEVPLDVSLYSRSHAMELIEGSGWQVVAVHDPARTAQHQFVCRAD